jgi:transposase-like protein
MTTLEQRIYIAPEDIVAVELECPNCHARISLRVGAKFDRGSKTCPNCNEDFYEKQSYTGSDFDHFISGLKMANHLKINAQIRLEIDTSKLKAIDVGKPV